MIWRMGRKKEQSDDARKWVRISGQNHVAVHVVVKNHNNNKVCQLTTVSDLNKQIASNQKHEQQKHTKTWTSNQSRVSLLKAPNQI